MSSFVEDAAVGSWLQAAAKLNAATATVIFLNITRSVKKSGSLTPKCRRR